jgi:two-component system chemotaxis response regulator CheB
VPAGAPAVRAGDRQLIVIGGSTGGIEALRTLLPRFPREMPPIAIVQHISPHFSRAVAERLDALSSLDVREAGQGDVLTPGMCVIAPGDAHLALEFSAGAYRTRLLKTPPIHHCRPAVDVLFRSAAEAGGDRVVAALLTGMGSDGAIGMQAIRAAGGVTIAEHESTCVVYGMPRAAIEAGAAERVLPLPAIADAIIDAVAHRARR